MNNKQPGNFARVSLVILLLTQFVLAGTTGKIAGKITDAQTGDALAGTNVVITGVVVDGTAQSLPSGQVYGASTDLDGFYYIVNIPPGNYEIEASYIGYATVKKSNVKVSVDYTTQLNFELAPVLEETETVIVTAEREMVRKDLTSSMVMVDADQIDRLPVRNIGDVIELQAGVVRDAGGELHIRGGRSTEIAYLVDGVQVLDPLSRSAGLTVDNQAVQELQTITGTFNAEYGQALSGVINTVTKQGSERFEMNFTGYLGDYLSFDKSVYSIMDNTSWANAAAHFYGQDPSGPIRYDLSSYEGSKSYLSQKAYLNTPVPWTNRDLQANFSGPLSFITNRLTFFISGRYNYDPGYIYGKRYFMPWGYQQPAAYPDAHFEKADNAIVPLNKNENYSMQGKIFWRPLDNMSLSYSLFLNDNKSKNVDYVYKYVPDAANNEYTQTQTHILNLNHTLSPSTFYELKLSYFDKDYKSYLYDDTADPRYVPQLTESGKLQTYLFGSSNHTITPSPNLDFAWVGNPTDRSKNVVKNWSAQLDLSSQVNRNNFVKMGLSGRQHDLYNKWYDLQFTDSPVKPFIPPFNSPYYNEYKFKPREFAAYIQDKIEFDELIINVGLRYDYFDPDGKVLADPTDPQIYNPFNPYHKYKNYMVGKPDSELVEYTIAEREAFWYKKASTKYQVSPRFGLSFPISERGVIHFSYGHFFQNPPLNNLYENSGFWIYGAGTQDLIGNADLGPERTVMYEVGLQQQITTNLFMHITGFYRDIRDWIGVSKPIDTYGGRTTYFKYINKDHGTAKGVTLNGVFSQQKLSVSVDYTFMVAQGTTSDPQEAYLIAKNKEEPRLQVIYLPWDQRHSLRTTFGYSYNDWFISLIASLQSGFPYTPAIAFGEATGTNADIGFKENSATRPTVYNVDMRLSRQFIILGLNYQLGFNIYNLFDSRNARTVYEDTGDPSYSSQSRLREARVQEIARVQELYNSPGNYYPPRFIQLVVGVNL